MYPPPTKSDPFINGHSAGIRNRIFLCHDNSRFGRSVVVLLTDGGNDVDLICSVTCVGGLSKMLIDTVTLRVEWRAGLFPECSCVTTPRGSGLLLLLLVSTRPSMGIKVGLSQSHTPHFPRHLLCFIKNDDDATLTVACRVFAQGSAREDCGGGAGARGEEIVGVNVSAIDIFHGP